MVVEFVIFPLRLFNRKTASYCDTSNKGTQVRPQGGCQHNTFLHNNKVFYYTIQKVFLNPANVEDTCVQRTRMQRF